MLLAAAFAVHLPDCNPHLASGAELFFVVHWISISLQHKCELKWQAGVYHDHKDFVHGWR